MTPKTSLSAVSLATRLPRNFEKPNVVVLGAGFSKEFGYPLANELFEGNLQLCPAKFSDGYRSEPFLFGVL
jgi:hypothetical protein